MNPPTSPYSPIFSKRIMVFTLASLCCLLWGSSYPAIKAGYALFSIASEDIPGKLVFAGWRFTMAGLVLLGFSLLSRRVGLRLNAREWRNVMQLGLLQTTVHYLFFYIGLAHTTGVKGSVINGSVSFFGVLLAHYFVPGDRLTWGKLGGCIIGFLGVLAVNFNPELLDFNLNLLGDGFVLIAAVIMAGSMVYGKHVSRTIDSMLMTGLQLGLGGLPLLLGGYLLGGSLASSSPSAFLLMAFLIFNSSMALSLWSVLLKYNGVGAVSVFNFLVPIFGAGLSALFLDETILEWKNLLALILVCAGIGWVNKKNS